jgi:nucleoid DNA-binding protein
MKTQDFYGALAAKADTTKAQAIAFVRALEEILAEEVRDKGETVAIGKVGKFVLKDQPSRMARNPQTGVTAPPSPTRPSSSARRTVSAPTAKRLRNSP